MRDLSSLETLLGCQVFKDKKLLGELEHIYFSNKGSIVLEINGNISLTTLHFDFRYPEINNFGG